MSLPYKKKSYIDLMVQMADEVEFSIILLCKIKCYFCYALNQSHVTQVITRLRHWPLCVAFDQWREFTEREVQLKSAAASVKSQHSRIQVLLAFREWKQSYLYNTRAQSFRASIRFYKLFRHRQIRCKLLSSTSITCLH